VCTFTGNELMAVERQMTLESSAISRSGAGGLGDLGVSGKRE
jgi:hypothetical protein